MQLNVICRVFNDAVTNSGFIDFQRHKLHITTGKQQQTLRRVLGTNGKAYDFYFANVRLDTPPEHGLLRLYLVSLRKNVEKMTHMAITTSPY